MTSLYCFSEFIHILPVTPLQRHSCTLRPQSKAHALMLHMSSNPPCFKVSENEIHPTACWISATLWDEKKSPAQCRTMFPSIACSYLFCDCTRPPVCTKAWPWPRVSGKLQHHFSIRDANPRQRHGAREGSKLNSLSEQSRLLFSKFKHAPKPYFQASPSSKLNHHMLKCPDLSAQRHKLPQRETQRPMTGTKLWTSLHLQALLE